VRLGLNPEINALGTLFIVVVTVGVLLNNHLMLRRQRRRDRDLALAFARGGVPAYDDPVP
jgi:putrescine transport system permease protein